MAKKRAKGEIRFKIHGLPTDGGGKLVDAEVFARKVNQIVKALETADVEANGAEQHRYLISELKIGSAQIGFREVVRSTRGGRPEHSSIAALLDCTKAVSRSNFTAAVRYGELVEHVQKLSAGAADTFAYMEMGVPDDTPIRVDDFLNDQAKTLLKERAATVEKIAYYRGHAREAFDGTIKEADLRGDLPSVKLILTAGGKEIDCICKRMTVEHIREALDRRVWAEGIAIYTGKSQLPSRVELDKIVPLSSEADLSKWRGSLTPFTLSDWEQ